MALRILSGMIFVPNGGTARGSVVTSFNPFQLAASSNPAFELRKEQEIGPRERFLRRPVTMVAARQFAILSLSTNPRVKLNDTVTRDSITSWSTSARTARIDQEEIPFLAIGEVPDMVTISRPTRGLVVEHPSDALRGRRKGRSKKSKGRGKKSKRARRLSA